MSLRTLPMPRRSVWLRGCLSLVVFSLLLILAAGALAHIGIQRGVMRPPQGTVYLGPIILRATVPQCPSFSRCVVAPGPGGHAIPLLAPPVYQYIVAIEVPSGRGYTTYKLVDMVLEGATVSEFWSD